MQTAQQVVVVCAAGGHDRSELVSARLSLGVTW